MKSLSTVVYRRILGTALLGVWVMGVQFSSVQGLAPVWLGVERVPASVSFPLHRATSDEGAILRDYKDYLNFALSIGQQTSPALARQLEQRFSRLQKADRRYAARFLKGLRFEMVQKLELVGYDPHRMSTRHPVMRKWVSRYLSAWVREVDEYQFRALAARVVKKPR